MAPRQSENTDHHFYERIDKMSKKKNTPKRVSVETRANGEVHLAIRDKSPSFSVAKDRKKEANKNRCRQTTGGFYLIDLIYNYG